MVLRSTVAEELEVVAGMVGSAAGEGVERRAVAGAFR